MGINFQRKRFHCFCTSHRRKHGHMRFHMSIWHPQTIFVCQFFVGRSKGGSNREFMVNFEDFRSSWTYLENFTKKVLLFVVQDILIIIKKIDQRHEISNRLILTQMRSAIKNLFLIKIKLKAEKFKSKVNLQLVQFAKATMHTYKSAMSNNNFNSIDLAGNSNRDLNFNSSLKPSQRLDHRLKSVMPELRGQSSRIYLTIKIHSSLENNNSNLIKQIKEELKVTRQGEIDLNSFIKWETFTDPKELLKIQYVDHELYYIIVQEKYLSWAETFAKQERADSQNKKKIHVLGLLKSAAFDDKIKLRARQRIDKIANYVHYYSQGNSEISKQIALLIDQHLEGSLQHENEHLKRWALLNKYAQKKVKKRTIHIYFDEEDRQTLENLYHKYNPKSKSSWLQLHPYQSFFDVVKSIKQRQALSIRQADKASQIAHQVTSKLAQSRSHIDLGTMRSVNFADNSQIFNNSVQAVSKLNKDDINIVIARTDFSELDKLKAFVKAQKLKNWDLIQINTDSPQFFQKMGQIFEVGRDFQKQYEQQKQSGIVKSKTLYVIGESSDNYTRELFMNQTNVFNNMEYLAYNNSTEFALKLREGVKSKDNYTVAVVPGGANTIDPDYENEIKELMKQYKNTDFIDNFTFISAVNGQHGSLLSVNYQNDFNTSRVYHVANSNDDNWLERIMVERDNYFHPFKGLKGSNVYILVKSSKVHLLKDLREYIGHSPRLQISTYIDKQYLNKQLDTILIKDSAIVVTDDQVLREAQEVLVKFDEAFIMNITNRKNLKHEVKVFAWGDKNTIYNLLQEIPENDEKLESEIYEDSRQRISLLRQNRFIPKKIQFLPGNTIVVRLPANLTDQESRKMEVRLKKYFDEEIKIEYYKEPSDIRLRNKTMEPFTFNILREPELDYMKTIAKKQIQEKRQEFILYDLQPQKYRYLIEQPEHERFRLLSNSWPDIQDYIIRTVDRPAPKVASESIYDDELIHVFVDNLPCYIQKSIEQQIDRTKLKAANNMRFYHKDMLEEILLMYPPNHKYYIVVEDHTFNNQSSVEVKRRLGEQHLQKAFATDPTKQVEIILINNSRGNTKITQDRIKCVHGDEKGAADWLSGIKVHKVDKFQSLPFILIDRNSNDWRYFLNKYSYLTDKFRFSYCNSKQDMKRTIEKIRYKEPAEEIWILVKNWKEYNECLRVADKIESGRNISILYHGDEEMKLQDHRKKIIFTHEDRKEVEKFILNPYRRSFNQFFPSSVHNPKVILAPVDTNYKLFKNIPLNRREIQKWKDILHAEVYNCRDFKDLQGLHEDHPQCTIYAIMSAQTEAKDRVKLQSMPEVKRIVLNMQSSYNPRTLRNNFKESNKQIYEASYPAEVSEYLQYLRYNIRNPESKIEQRYPKELTQIYALQKTQINDVNIMRYILAKNDSITRYQTFEPSQLRQTIEFASKNDYNTIFIGDNSVATAVTEKNRSKNLNMKFFHTFTNPPYRGNSISEMQTNEQDEVKQYLYNMPENRYDRMRVHRGKFIIYYDINNQSKTYLQMIDYIKKSADRNDNIKFRGYSEPKQLNTQIKEKSYVLVNSQDEKYYNNLLKSNSHVKYLIVNENDPNRNLTPNRNQYFINRHLKEYHYFFDNLAEFNGNSVDPLPLKVDQSINGVLKSIQNYNSEPMEHNFHEFALHPPLKTLDEPIPRPQPQPILFTSNLLDENPPNLQNIPFAIASPPTLSLGATWVENIKKHKLYVAPPILPIQPPMMDTPPSEFEYKTHRTLFHSSEESSQTLTILPSLPKKHIQRFHLAILYINTNEFKNFGHILKQNLEPKQYTVELMGFQNQHELNDYAKGNGSLLNTFDKIVIFLTPQYRKFDQGFKSMKARLDPRMEYFYFDDNFHAFNHQTLGNHLRPYNIRKVPLPWQNPNLPRQWQNQGKFNIFVPLENRKYESLKRQNVKVIPYSHNLEIDNHLHNYGVFNIIVCNRLNYHNLKEYCEQSPRCTILVQDTQDLYEDELYFYRFPQYSVYYGSNGLDYLRRSLPKKLIQKSSNCEMVYYLPNQREAVLNGGYEGYEKVEYANYVKLYEYLVNIFYTTQYRHFLYKHSPVVELVPLNACVYLQNTDWMKEYKNNFLERGHMHETQPGVKSQMKVHQFSQLPEVYYDSEKHLNSKLERENSPCVVMYNGSNRIMEIIREKFKHMHKFVKIINDTERWIQIDGSFVEVQKKVLIKKQDMLVSIFNERVFDDFNDFQYYYLSNKSNHDHRNNIYFRTKEDLEEIYENNVNLLMCVFVQSRDKKHIPQSLLAEYQRGVGRVKIIYVETDFVDDNHSLYVKYNEIDPVIRHINRIEFSGRRDFLVFREIDGDKKRRDIIMKNQLQNIDSHSYSNMDQIEEIGQKLKGQFKKVYVICFPFEQDEIATIFEKYSVKNKPNSNESVGYYLINQASTIVPSYSPSKIVAEPSHQIYSVESEYMQNSKNKFPPRSPVKVSKSSKFLEIIEQEKLNHYEVIPAADEEFKFEADSEARQQFSSEEKFRNLVLSQKFDIHLNRKLKNSIPKSQISGHKIEYFDKVQGIPRKTSLTPQLIISNERFDQLQDLCSTQPENMVVYVSNQNQRPRKGKSQNTLIINEEQIPTLIKQLQEHDSDDDNVFNKKMLEDYEHIIIVYNDSLNSRQKGNLLLAACKNLKILPTKFTDMKTLTGMMKDSNSLVMLYMKDEPQGLDRAVRTQDYKVIKKRRTKILLPNKAQDIDGLETILQEDQNDDYGMKVQTMNERQIDNYLQKIETMPEDRQILFDFNNQISKASSKKNQQPAEDHTIKLNVYSNVMPQDNELFGDEEIDRIKQRLDGNLICLVIQQSKREEVKEITNRYNILVQGYNNTMNLQTNLRDRKDSTTIAVINKKIIENIIPLKKKYPQITFILQSDMIQEELMEQYRPYISGRVSKMAELWNIIAKIYPENQRIRYKDHSTRITAPKLEKKKPLISMADFGNNEKLFNAVNNQKSKKVFLFFKQPDNTHIKLKLNNDIFAVVTFIPYKTVANLKNLLGKYNSYSSIVIANGEEIPEIEDHVSKKKENAFVIRFNPPEDFKGKPRVKMIYSTIKKQDLEDYLYTEFMKIVNLSSYEKLESKLRSPPARIDEKKKYKQSFQPNTFGTTARFQGDFVPPKSQKDSYSHHYIGSLSRNKMKMKMGSEDGLKSRKKPSL